MKLSDPRWLTAKSWATRARARECSTSLVPLGPGVKVGVVEGRPRVAGLMRCGDVHCCPHCRNAIMKGKADLIEEIGAWAIKNERYVYHVTLNHRHFRGERPMWVREAKMRAEDAAIDARRALTAEAREEWQKRVERLRDEAEEAESRWLAYRLREEREASTEAWRRMTAGRVWRDFTADSGWVAVRSLEVTHGAHGWHPHLHLLVSTAVPLDGFAFAALASRWRASFRNKYGEPDFERQGVEHVMLHARELDPSELSTVAHYITKGAFAAQDAAVKAMADEIASGTSKEGGRERDRETGVPGRTRSLTPWELLGGKDGTPCTDAGPVAPRTLWRAYTLGMLGARCITFPKSLLRELGLTELSDLMAAIARDEAPEPVAIVGREAWGAIRKARMWHLLDALAGAASEGVLDREWLEREWGPVLAFDVVLRDEEREELRVECLPSELWDVAHHLRRVDPVDPLTYR